MIRTPDRGILLLESDGAVVPFEPLELQIRLSGCFLASGLKDQSFLSEDIALAVEFALRQIAVGEKPFLRSELNTTVLQILRNTGFPEVANRYAEICSCLRIDCANQTDAISAILRRFLLRSEKCCTLLAAKVADALTKLQIGNAPHTLILELARFYDYSAVPDESPAPAATEQGHTLLVSAPDLACVPETGPELRRLLDTGIVRYGSVSRVFPAVRLGVNLGKLAETRGLSKPLTELEFFPLLREIAPILDQACAIVLKRVANFDIGEPPVCLNLLETQKFAVDFLESEWPRGRKAAREFIKLAADLMNTQVSRVATTE